MNTNPPVQLIVVNGKSTLAAYLLWFFFGFLGFHKFYLGKTLWGFLYLFTGGLFFVGLFIDLFTIPAQVRNYNQGILQRGLWN